MTASIPRRGCVLFALAAAMCFPITTTTAATGHGTPERGRHQRRATDRPPTRAPSPVPPASPSACPDPGVLCASAVDVIVKAGAAILAPKSVAVAVSDRVGNILGIYRQHGASDDDAERAVGLARTAAFFSNNQAPLSSRTVRFISGKHFPPGIANTPNAALYGIENTNRGCDFNVIFEPNRFVPRARSAAGIAGDLACDSTDRSGCSRGIVTGKLDSLDSDFRAVDPGGVPIFHPAGAGPAEVLGGVGIAGSIAPEEAEYAAFRAAIGDGSTLPVPQFPLPAPGNVFIDGIRLPFVNQVSPPATLTPGTPAGNYDAAFPPKDGVSAPSGYLVGPTAGTMLTMGQVDTIVRQSIAAAAVTRANIRLPLGSCTRMVISVADLDGSILALYRMPDATVFSIDVAVAKARNVVYFSGPDTVELGDVPLGTAVTNRTLSFGAQPLYPPGIDGTNPGPFFALFVDDTAQPCTQGRQPANLNQNQSGIVFFPGSTPLYVGGAYVGGLGVSGDGVEQDDYVTFLGAAGFLPPDSIRANQIFVDGVRLPYLKFPRNPGACTP